MGKAFELDGIQILLHHSQKYKYVHVLKLEISLVVIYYMNYINFEPLEKLPLTLDGFIKESSVNFFSSYYSLIALCAV